MWDWVGGLLLVTVLVLAVGGFVASCFPVREHARADVVVLEKIVSDYENKRGTTLLVDWNGKNVVVHCSRVFWVEIVKGQRVHVVQRKTLFGVKSEPEVDEG